MDLAVTAGQVALAPGTTGTQTVTVVNNGSAATTGGTRVTYLTPAYVNIDRAKPLPAGCELRFEDQDPTVPEVLTCVLPAGLAPAAPVTIDVPVAVTTRARVTGVIRGRVSALPVPGSADVEADPADNWTLAYLTATQPTPALPEGNKVGLYLTHAMPAQAKDGTSTLTITYGNVGPADTAGAVRVTVATPFYTNVDRAKPLPEGCAFQLEDPSPGIPEIVTCEVPALKVEQQRTLDVPLKAVDGGPKGIVLGPTIISPASSSDVDTDQTDNLDVAGVMVPSRGK
ncbi:hypothetical protein CFP71_28445 [Amycolatopsis thailandensis]|uniref:DUF11 domain-containing protein n=1 Tax=Amycolatopsis thailandensis TaxID=589330 RepID=A0A229RUM7_9PSEU|nr:hypothetical protein CFP71_28445 [Amycolatopsis thailandensis]